MTACVFYSSRLFSHPLRPQCCRQSFGVCHGSCLCRVVRFRSGLCRLFVCVLCQSCMRRPPVHVFRLHVLLVSVCLLSSLFFFCARIPSARPSVSARLSYSLSSLSVTLLHLLTPAHLCRLSLYQNPSVTFYWLPVVLIKVHVLQLQTIKMEKRMEQGK